ncbi:FAD-dependent monooxygenase [Sorangium sp. So ce542]|uniref:FAD-dependent monooxygenase n=1 Tax=Sorangium sp. So ce542 TaxID=3133316 RepID=UPI003F5F2F2C
MDKQVDVVVVGAGPVGLLLAIELELGGAGLMVLERLTAPSAAIKGTAVGPLGVEAIQRRSMGPALAEAEDRHFAAMGPAGAARRALIGREMNRQRRQERQEENKFLASLAPWRFEFLLFRPASQTRRRNAQLNAARWSETAEASPASEIRAT